MPYKKKYKIKPAFRTQEKLEMKDIVFEPSSATYSVTLC